MHCTLAAVHVLRVHLRAEVDELQVQDAVLDRNREAPRRERWRRQGHATPEEWGRTFVTCRGVERARIY